MDDVGEIKRLREEYEGALDEAETKRATYHRAIKKMHLSGVPLREIAEQLGVSHQRVHQIVTGEPERRPKRSKTARNVVAVVLLFAVTAAGVTLAFAWRRRGPFTPVAEGPIASNLVSMPSVTAFRHRSATTPLSK